MKRVKGYTLAEMIATMAILSIFLVAMPMFVSTIINGEKRMNDRIQYSSYIERIEQVLSEKDKVFFENMNNKIITFEFSTIEDIYKLLNKENIELKDNKLNAKIKIKRATEKADGMYLINISVVNINENSMEMKKEFLVRRNAS